MIDLVRINLIPGTSKPNSVISSILGSKGVNPFDFCKRFSELTSNIKSTDPINVKVFIKNKLIVKILLGTPTVSYLVKKHLNLKKLSSKSCDVIGFVNFSFIKDLISVKFKSLSSYTFSTSLKIILGSLKSMGILFKNEI